MPDGDMTRIGARARKGDPDLASRLIQLRRRVGSPWPLSQAAFAGRYGLSAGMVRDVEQCRVQPSRAFRLLVALIEDDPKHVAEIAARLATEPR